MAEIRDHIDVQAILQTATSPETYFGVQCFLVDDDQIPVDMRRQYVTDRSYALTPLEELRTFADRYDMGVVLDTTHAKTAGDNLLQAWQTLNGKLANVHLSDMGGQHPLPSVSRVRHLLGGTGYRASATCPWPIF